MKGPTNEELGLSGREVLRAPINLIMLTLIYPLCCLTQPLGFGWVGEIIIYFLLFRIWKVLFQKDVFIIHPKHVLGFGIIILIIFGYYGYENFF